MSLVDIFSALGDPTRCRVVEMLHEKSRPVHELAAEFDISRPAISRHLRVLKQAGLVREEKAGRENVYSLQRGKLRPAGEWLEKRASATTARKTARKAPVIIKPAPAPIEPLQSVVPKRVAKPPKTQVESAIAPEAAPQLSFFDL